MTDPIVLRVVSIPPTDTVGDQTPATAGADGGLRVDVASGTITSTATAATATAPATLTYPNAGLLQGQGVWMLGPVIAIPAGAKRVSFDCTYTGRGATSQVEFRLRFGHTSGRMGVEAVDDSTITVSGSVGAQNEYDHDRVRPVSGSSPTTWPIRVDVTDEPFVALDFAEAVQDGAGAGTVNTVTWVASYA